jgi:hypothetical protein
MITQPQLEKFKTLYKNHFGEELSDQEALEQATKLLRLVEIVIKE